MRSVTQHHAVRPVQGGVRLLHVEYEHHLGQVLRPGEGISVLELKLFLDGFQFCLHHLRDVFCRKGAAGLPLQHKVDTLKYFFNHNDVLCFKQ